MKDGRWLEPQPLDDQINLEGYTSTHPTMGRESKKNQEVLYFVSDRPGTRGGLDIWYTEYDARKKMFKKPKNAGSKLNTVGSEATPFYDVKTKTLYYSTDGKANIGGLDVFKAAGELNKWDPSVNLGTPINSTADDLDFALSVDGKGGFVVSNRKGGQSLYNATCCDDIYEFVKTEFIVMYVTGNVLDKRTKEFIKETTVNVYIVNGEEKYLAEQVKSKNGEYTIQLRPGFNYSIEPSTEGYLNTAIELSTTQLKKTDTLKRNVELLKISDQPIVIPQVNYEFNSPVLTLESKMILDTTLVQLLKRNPDIIVEISSHTDNKGTDEYNNALSQKRAESVVTYLKSKGIKNDRLKAKGYGESKPVAPNENADGSDNPEGRQLNRRTEFRIIGKIDLSLIQYETVEEKKQKLEKKKNQKVKEEEEDG
jgi:outer membrane protein OmpA-like peptidoglycan-associated protein